MAPIERGLKCHTFRFQVLDQTSELGRNWKDDLVQILSGDQ